MKRHQVQCLPDVACRRPPQAELPVLMSRTLGFLPLQVMRISFLFLLLLSVATVHAEEAEPTPAAEAGAEAAAEAAAEAELPPLDCTTTKLLAPVGGWSVDCVAMWLQNLGFPELRGAFMGNNVDGKALTALTMEKLAEDYGVSDEEQQKKIYYNLKDVVRKDDSSGNTNHYSMMLFWLLPVLGVYKWLSLKYEKEIEKSMKKYQKWQDKRNPPKPVETVVYEDGTNEWISGLNGDVGGAASKRKSAAPKSDKKKRTSKVE